MKQEVAVRAVIFVVCLGLLTGLFILGGAGWSFSPSDEPSPHDLDEDYEEFVGERVELSGEVVDPEGPVVEIDHESELLLELDGVEKELEENQGVTFYGEVRPDGTVEVDSSQFAPREPWEMQYMYVISIVGAVLTAVMGINYWRFDRRELAFEPRNQPLVAILTDDGGGDGG